MRAIPLVLGFAAAMALRCLAIAQAPATYIACAMGLALALPSPCQSDTERLVAACNRFALDLHRQVAGETSSVCAPGSVAVELLMLLTGARGDTANEIATALRLPPDMRGDALLRAARWLSVVGGNRPDLCTTADLWVQSGITVVPEYTALLRDTFGANVQTVDFARDRDGARDAINRHVAWATSGHVRDLLLADALRDKTRFVVTNAAWFRGVWTATFSRPQPGAFHLDADRQADVPMMKTESRSAYAASETWQAVSLTFRGSPVQFDLVVPRTGRAVADAEAALGDPDLWRNARHPRVALTMPSFDVSRRCSLSAALRALGVRAAFTEKSSDFSGMLRMPPFLDDVVHVSRIKVDREGVEATGATAGMGPVTGGPDGPGKTEEPEVIVADRPFAFALRDNRTGLVLFLGRVVDPRAP